MLCTHAQEALDETTDRLCRLCIALNDKMLLANVADEDLLDWWEKYQASKLWAPRSPK